MLRARPGVVRAAATPAATMGEARWRPRWDRDWDALGAASGLAFSAESRRAIGITSGRWEHSFSPDAVVSWRSPDLLSPTPFQLYECRR